MDRPFGLIDTGVILALLQTRDRSHVACTRAVAEIGGGLATSLAVVTEVLHFESVRPDRLEAAWRLLRSRFVRVMPIDATELAAVERLMLKYVNVPMDFADATLVHLAEQNKLDLILSLDSDFDVYRIGAKGRFRRFPKA